jgi:fimbrial chaperone protein
MRRSGRPFLFGRGAAGALAAALLILAAPAARAISVEPVVIDLSPSGSAMSRVITVDNTSDQPLPIEVRVDQISFDANGAQTTKPSEDLLAFPPQVVVPPGRSQAVRVQWAGDATLAQSRSYYVTIAQQPVKLSEGQSGVQVVYDVQVLVSVAPPGVKPHLEVVSAEIGHDSSGKPVPVITVRNTSNAHGYLSGGSLRIVEKNSSGAVVFQKTLTGGEIQQTSGFGLVEPAQTRKMTLPVVLPLDGGSVEVHFSPASR